MKYASPLILLITSILITLFLFYIDEGHYSLRGIMEVGSLITMSIYLLIIFITQLFLFRLFKRRMAFLPAILMAFVTGGTIGTLVTAGFFLSLSAI